LRHAELFADKSNTHCVTSEEYNYSHKKYKVKGLAQRFPARPILVARYVAYPGLTGYSRPRLPSHGGNTSPFQADTGENGVRKGAQGRTSLSGPANQEDKGGTHVRPHGQLYP
jgi:hypothetical protein